MVGKMIYHVKCKKCGSSTKHAHVVYPGKLVCRCGEIIVRIGE